jgi:hypothetical protein
MTTIRTGFRLGLILAGLALAAHAQPPPPAAAGPRAVAVKVANQTKQAIVAVYSSIPGREDWSADMLGKAKLGAGKTLSLKLVDATGECLLDFSALMDNGDTKVQKGVDLCGAAPLVQF